MINRLKAFLSAPGTEPAGAKSVDALHLAAAALLVEAARTDSAYDEVEQKAVAEAIKTEFGLNDEECASLIAEAEIAQHEATGLYRFTHTINTRFNHADRIRLLEMLWAVIYADGELHPYESSLMRGLGHFLHVTDRERVEARRRVLDRLTEAKRAAGRDQAPA
jgi:uncharacterized tellurite resistance protein B-like protein